jgi:hypothetical protein
MTMFRHASVHRIIAITLIAPLIGVQGFRTLWAAEQPADADLATEGMRRLGPFYLRPFVTLKDVGYDDNVRLEAQEREGDATATAGGGLDAVLLTGDRGGARFFNSLDYVTFARNTDLAHWNGRARARGVLLMKTITLSLEDDFVSVRERPNTEVDLRLRRENNAVTAALKSLSEGRLNVKSYLRSERIDYTSEETTGDAEAQRLDRDERSIALAGELEVLPKTTLTAEGAIRRIEFINNIEGRDSRETSFLLGLRFDPSASLQGWFRVGKANLSLPNHPEDDFRGTVGEGQLSKRLGNFARIKTTFARGTEFSTLAENAYYVGTTWTAAYEQLLTRRLTGELLYGRGKNHYPEPVTRTGPPLFQGIRDDRLTTYQAGVRFRVGEQMAIVARAYRMVRDSTDGFYDRERNVYTFGTTYSF